MEGFIVFTHWNMMGDFHRDLAAWVKAGKVIWNGRDRSQVSVERRRICASLPAMQSPITLRVARPTDDLDALLPFYCHGLELSVLYRFEDHDGFDGIMLGAAGAPYPFEFTRAAGHIAGRAPSKDHLLIFYQPDLQTWGRTVDRLREVGFEPVPAFNPYWDRDGLTFEDPDGYRIVLQNAAWNR
jgi:Glyoxalase/Bleomycin resistance protein/Dioxygenase superfamily